MRNLRVLRSRDGKLPKELERLKSKAIISTVVLPGLAEANEAEGPARRSADREVAGHEVVVQVSVVLARVNDLPRAPTGSCALLDGSSYRVRVNELESTSRVHPGELVVSTAEDPHETVCVTDDCGE